MLVSTMLFVLSLADVACNGAIQVLRASLPFSYSVDSCYAKPIDQEGTYHHYFTAVCASEKNENICKKYIVQVDAEQEIYTGVSETN